jgi:phosphatidylserine synthase
MSIARRVALVVLLLAVCCGALLLPDQTAVTMSRYFLGVCFLVAAIITWRKSHREDPQR